MTAGQRAAVAVEMLPMLEKENEDIRRQKISAARQGETTQRIGLSPDRHTGESTQQAAAITGANRQYVSDAKRIKEKAPELLEKVKACHTQEEIAAMVGVSQGEIAKSIPNGDFAEWNISESGKATANHLTDFEPPIYNVWRQEVIPLARKRDAISSTRSLLYDLVKALGDTQAVRKGTVGRRIGRRVAGKVTGRLLGRLFR